MSKKIFRVPDMHCPACVMILEGLEDSLTGIRSISASYHKQQMEITYDESRLSEVNIITAAEELGYTAIPSNS
jgi:copper chaperone CopZ